MYNRYYANTEAVAKITALTNAVDEEYNLGSEDDKRDFAIALALAVDPSQYSDKFMADILASIMLDVCGMMLEDIVAERMEREIEFSDDPDEIIDYEGIENLPNPLIKIVQDVRKKWGK